MVLLLRFGKIFRTRVSPPFSLHKQGPIQDTGNGWWGGGTHMPGWPPDCPNCTTHAASRAAPGPCLCATHRKALRHDSGSLLTSAFALLLQFCIYCDLQTHHIPQHFSLHAPQQPCPYSMQLSSLMSALSHLPLFFSPYSETVLETNVKATRAGYSLSQMRMAARPSVFLWQYAT